MPCVLIVEDDPDLRELMEFILAVHGYETISAWNGLQALEKMAARRPDVVLLDLHMPVMDGVEFRRQQLEDPQRRDVPLIAVTAHHNPREVERRLGVKCLEQAAVARSAPHGRSPRLHRSGSAARGFAAIC